MFKPAILVLTDGSVFSGKSIGADGHTIGEVVFNTAMTGYQEILTDPSYTKQIVTLTYPHIGNTGINLEDKESPNVCASGLIIRDLPLLHSNFRASSSLSDYLIQQNIVAIADIDTRRLTRILREKGAQAGCILVGNATEDNIANALAFANSFGSMAGKDLAQSVTCNELYKWTDGEWQLGKGYVPQQQTEFHVVAYDYGVKHNILRMLAERGCRLTVVPAKTSAEAVLALNPDGIFLSNGPGDPEPCDYAITAIRKLLETQKPIFGICLGHQLLGLAAGGKTKKMVFGHHGANHPVQDLDSQKVLITSQNHGFEVDESSLPSNVRVTHRSLFDGTVQGIELTDRPAFSFQGHPEASPGPNDVAYLFDRFVSEMKKVK
ncbi:glutamine-hydrolyzing carbamoyl-phosphate synthase small subunit [Mannheimia haemolytica]|uniref:glutamine-hydrolyzing carbamoyl-phosphate synthase small subunit n=1 Tax=Mannheimia haemolytica TaxID=75985 RepID=UPI000589CF72|nr:glutamine-hydrolyzing carbamoyl-phosphate synthase small subunit [Mannheimia haemolytica]AJE06906.2 carbamoyl-phosphate synthase small subunit [Mannheimia haemolytica USDA-ARS-USMARC-184]KYL11515.1 carbamoyl-phosphate synthase [Mannheimia haemolytica]UFK43189.1 glutamine-hydrolyzing carbamoyl-phosphate synthase small subunit [Mannheimia haemolytica]UQX62928.1 glutamine-hydrolyzing carbamoyl-phosphate synthase small subunit [Mannheimia haemolytica]HDL1111998.1 glutamine-hydrolyzing carbamoyl